MLLLETLHVNICKMKDEAFINTILQKGSEAKDKARNAFSGISPEQLNWKPSLQKWSIAQCLDHLVISDSSYFAELEKIIAGNYRMKFWEKYSPFTGMLGKIMKDRLQEEPKIKMKTSKKIQPSSGEMDMGIIDRYHKNLDRFLEYISNCRSVDLDKIIITSPITSVVTYSLRDALQFLIQHEHRHLNQAIRVKVTANFPE